MEYFYIWEAVENKTVGPSQLNSVSWEREGAGKLLYHPSFFEVHHKSVRQEMGIRRGGEGAAQ